VAAHPMNDAMACREPEPGPFAPLLGREKGSKRCKRTSSVMPQPVSVTDSRTCLPERAPGFAAANALVMFSLAVSMMSRPPSGIASRALTVRLTRSCSIWLGSASTVPMAGASIVSMAMFSPRRAGASSVGRRPAR